MKIEAKVSTNCKKQKIKYEKSMNLFKIRVKSPPERGKANSEIIKMFDNLGIRADIVSGLTSNKKLIKLDIKDKSRLIEIIQDYAK